MAFWWRSAVRTPPVMAIDNECEGYARECVRLAGLAKDQHLRDQFLDMAREWMSEAMHERPKPLKEDAARH
jgi:hypothetical protein